MQIFIVAAMLVLNNIVFEFSNVFHAAMLSGVAPRARLGGLSGSRSHSAAARACCS